MRNLKFYSLILSAVAFAGTAMAVQPCSKVLSSSSDVRTQILFSERTSPREARKALRAVKPARKAPVSRAIESPENLKIVTEAPKPEELKLGVKSGMYYTYNWLFGSSTSRMTSNLSQYEIVDGKFYMNYPFAGSDTNGFLVGDVDGNTITIKFPQWVDHYEDYNVYDELYTVEQYALLCEFKPTEEGSTTGWYYPSETQTLTLTINANGEIENPKWEELLIGSCDWVTEEYDEATDDYVPVENPYWEWNGNGDALQSMREVTEQAAELPANLQFENWTMINGISGSTVEVAVDGNDMYLRGLFKRDGCNPAIKGTINGDKVTFESGQYLGPYMYNMTLLYFQGVKIDYDEYGDVDYFNIIPALEFAYDKEKKDLKATDAALFSSLKDKVKYYNYYEAPHIFVPDASLTGHKLIDPVITTFYPVEDGYSGELVFQFPTIDANGNMLDKKKLFYNVFIDDEIFVVYADEYPDDVPEGEESMTNIPYTHDGWDIDYNGTKHYFYFYVEGFESMAVQTLYIDGDFTSKSGMMYAFRSDGVESAFTDGNVKSEELYNLQGVRVDKNYKGLVLRKAVMEDGSVKTSKLIRK